MAVIIAQRERAARSGRHTSDAGAPAGGTDVGDGHAGGCKRLEDVTVAECRRLQQGTEDVGRRVVQRQSDQRAACQRVTDRCAVALPVVERRQSAGTRGQPVDQPVEGAHTARRPAFSASAFRAGEARLSLNQRSSEPVDTCPISISQRPGRIVSSNGPQNAGSKAGCCSQRQLHGGGTEDQPELARA